MQDALDRTAHPVSPVVGGNHRTEARWIFRLRRLIHALPRSAPGPSSVGARLKISGGSPYQFFDQLTDPFAVPDGKPEEAFDLQDQAKGRVEDRLDVFQQLTPLGKEHTPLKAWDQTIPPVSAIRL